jgi:hypothetical protein
MIETGLVPNYQMKYLRGGKQFEAIRFKDNKADEWLDSVAAKMVARANAGMSQCYVADSEYKQQLISIIIPIVCMRYGIKISEIRDEMIVLKSGIKIHFKYKNFRTLFGFSGDVVLDISEELDMKKMWCAFVPVIGAVKGSLTVLVKTAQRENMFNAIYNDTDRYGMFTRY